MVRTAPLVVPLACFALLGSGCAVFFGDASGQGGSGQGGSSEGGAGQGGAGGSASGGGGSGGVGPSVGFVRVATVTVDPEAPLEEEHDDVPVLVRLGPSDIDYGAMRADGLDLLFTDENGSELPHEVELWNRDGESIVWVSLPTIGAASSSELRMYYGDPDRVVEARPHDVWKEHYEVVFHFGETSGATRATNSAKDAHHGVFTGTQPQAAKLGRGRRFSNAGPSMVQIEDSDSIFSGWSDFTYEMWIRPDYPADTSQIDGQHFVDKMSSGEPPITPLAGGRLLTAGINTQEATSLINLQIDLHFTASGSCYHRVNGARRQEHNYTGWSLHQGAVRSFLDGEPASDACNVGSPLRSSSRPVTLGRPGSSFRGELDEVRISQRGHSPEWFRIQHLSMTGDLLTFGPAQPLQ